MPPSICDPLTRTLVDKGIETAIGQYRSLKGKSPNTYDFSETELNNLGYQLIGRKMLTEAIEVFKLNVEAYPTSFNVYDSLGEAYMVNDDRELAIKNYEKSVELNPENTNGIEKLKELKAP